MSSGYEGEGPNGEQPSEGSPPDDPGRRDDVHGDLPDLEPEFVEALREAAGRGAEPPEEPPDPAPEEPESPAQEPEPPTEEQPRAKEQHEPPGQDPEHTVEFTPQELTEAQQASGADGGDGTAQPETEAEADAGEETEKGAENGGGDGDGDKPRRSVVIGAGPQTATPAPEAVPTATAVAAPPAVPPLGIPQKPPAEGDWEPAPKRKRLWLRFLIGSILIFVSMAGASMGSGLLYLGGIAGDLGHLPGVKKQLLPPETGQPENILFIGSDKRASLKGTRGLSDTTILLRLDPNNNAIALMSIPRDLKTYVPGVGVTKFNAAYAYGGAKLTLRIVKRITGLPINHVVNIDFLGFQRAVNAVGCVYVEVDRRYYHSNVGLPPSLQYSEINIQPGYQKLCGKDALAYVRYRHTDTDLVRSARQQDFLREARQQVPAQDLFVNKRDELINIFTKYTTSDISDGETLLEVLKLFVASRSAPIKEVHFPAILHPSFVTASKPAILAAVNQFRGIQASGGPRGSLDLPQSSGQTGIVPQERKRAKAAKKAKHGPKAPPTPSPANDGLVDASQFSQELAAKVAAKTLHSFPVFYPRRLPSGAIYVQTPRVYHLRDTNKNTDGAYVEILQLPAGDYFDIQGVHGWTNPPILNGPSESRTMNGRDYNIFLDGDRVRLISWHQGDNTYWVSNSLLQTLSNDQMLGIARSIGKLPGQRHPKHAKKKR